MIGLTHEIALLLPAASAIPLAAAWIRWKLRHPSGGLRLHDKVPHFNALPASDGGQYSLHDLRGSSALVFIFTANRCPGAKAYEKRLADLHGELNPAGARIIGVNSISSDLYPTEALAELTKAQAERGIEYPILRDADQRLAHAFGALCTPHAFVFDRRMRLRYRGRIDNSFIAANATQHYLNDAVRAVLDDRDPPIRETMPIGCAIDWVRPKPNPSVPWWKRAHEPSRTPNDHSYRG